MDYTVIFTSSNMMLAFVLGGWAANIKRETGSIFWIILFISMQLFSEDYTGMLIYYMGYLMEDVYPIWNMSYSKTKNGIIPNKI